MKYCLVFILFMIVSCNHVCIPQFNEECELQVFNSKTSLQSSSGGGFFLIAGAWNSSTKEITEYYFYAKNRNNEYCRFTVDPDQIRIKFDTCKIPTVKFNINSSNYNLETVFANISLLRSSLRYNSSNSITITCNPEQFPQNINLTILQ